MKTYLTHSLYCFLLFTITLPASGQQIFPGDVDNNGKVENIDALLIGIAHGFSGPERPVKGLDPKGTDAAPPWNTAFEFNGVNYNFADVDGNGVVDAEDLAGVRQNFGKGLGQYFSYEYEEAQEINSPALFLIPSRESIEGGGPINFTFHLGAPDFPLDNIYGVAFTFYFDTTYIGNFDSDINLFDGENWLANLNPSSSNELLSVVLDSSMFNGRVQMALVRKDQTLTAGNGPLLSSSIVIEDIIIGAKETSLKFGVDNVYVIDTSFNVTPVVWGETEIINLTAVGTKQVNPNVILRVFPNPANQDFILEIPENSESPVEQLLFMDSKGAQFLVPYSRIATNQFSVRSSSLPPGLYVVVAAASTEIYTTRVLIE